MEVTSGPISWLSVLFAVSSWGQPWGSQQGYDGWSWSLATGTNLSMGDKWWKCKNCATDNKIKSACTICGLRRSCAEVAKQATDQSTRTGAEGKQGNPVRQHLEEVASKLAAIAAGRGSHQAVAMQTSDFKACKAKLAKLEAALRAMSESGEDFPNERAATGAKIAETKAGVAENKPIGARIDAARGHFTRVQQRAQEASAALEMAQRRASNANCTTWKLRLHPSSTSSDRCGQHSRRSQWAVTTTPRHTSPKRTLEWTPTWCPQLQLTLDSSSRDFNMLSRKWSGNVVFKPPSPRETSRETNRESPSVATAHDDQNEHSEKASRRNRSSDERRDLGLVKERSCFGGTSLNTMTVATANVRRLHLKQIKVWRNNDAWESRSSRNCNADAAIDVVGFQESRSRQAGIFHGPLYRRYCGAADSTGNAGCSWNFTMLTMDDISSRLLVIIGRRANSGTLLLRMLPVNTRHTKKNRSSGRNLEQR